MKKLLNMFVAWLFGSVRVSKEMKPSASEGGNFVETKSVKRNELFSKGAEDASIDTPITTRMISDFMREVVNSPVQI